MAVSRQEEEELREDTVPDVSSSRSVSVHAANVTAAPKRLAAGDVVADRFVIERTLGSGGMGQVHAARHLKLGTRVAIKVVHPELAADEQAVARFLREAHAMASLESEHVVRIHDVGELPDGVPYLIMDYLEGRDLSALLAERGPLPVALALDYIRQACEALAAAHAAGIIHRDVKPQNLFITKKPSGGESVRVLDFGLAKAAAPEANVQQLTKAGHVLGTAHYMAPEQLIGGGVIDARTDVWSVGATLFRLLTKEYAFQESNPALAAVAIIKREAAPLKSIRPDVPEAVAAIVERCLTKDPSRRFQSMTELANAIDHARAAFLSPPTPSQPFGPLSVNMHAPLPVPPPVPILVPRPAPPATPWIQIAIAVVLLLAAAGALGSVMYMKKRQNALVAPASASTVAKGESRR